MKDSQFGAAKLRIIDFGKLLWDKDLVGGLNGNISLRVDSEKFLITGTGACLGRLTQGDVVLLGIDGKVIGNGKPSSEKLLHSKILKAFPNINAVIHTHTTYTNAFFLRHNIFKPMTFEAAYYLGEVHAVPQDAINVTDPVPVIRRLRRNRIVVLRRHGVVAMGEDLFECFLRIQGLEEQVKIEAVSNLFQGLSRKRGIKRGRHG
jgi:ribulose-5-phosphate 4-epimerase/fuculose-1-phosphate aldolase